MNRLAGTFSYGGTYVVAENRIQKRRECGDLVDEGPGTYTSTGNTITLIRVDGADLIAVTYTKD